MRRRRAERDDWVVKGPKKSPKPGPAYAVPDDASDEDALGFGRFAKLLATNIAGIAYRSTPWTVGIYGAWGSGKTTFLNLVEKELVALQLTSVVRFNAWKYGREEDLWSALIQVILNDLRIEGWGRRAWVRLRIWRRSLHVQAGMWEVARKVWGMAFRVALVAIFVLMFASVAVADVAKPIDTALNEGLRQYPALASTLTSPALKLIVGAAALMAANPMVLMRIFDVKLGVDFAKFNRPRTYREKIAFIEEFNKDFRDIIEVACPDKPLVIIIDDLDRCLPEQTLQILETVKLFLDVRGCVFLLAADRDIIEHAIAVKYKDLTEKTTLRNLGETYFEKIVQLPFSLPPPDEQRVADYVRGLTTDPDVGACQVILRGAKPYNPRRIKRNVQMFVLLKELAASEFKGGHLVPGVLAKLVVIQAQFRELYREAINDPQVLTQLERHYRRPSAPPEAPEGRVAAQVDPLSEARAENYAERYPDLPNLLCLSAAEDDSFENVTVSVYLSLVDVVADTDLADDRPVAVGDPVATTASLSGNARFVVSCVRRDFRWAEWLSGVLEEAGYIVSTSVHGDEDATQLSARLASADYLVAVVSGASVGSGAVQREWAQLLRSRTKLIGVRVDETVLPDFLAAESIFRADSGAAETRAALLSAIRPEDRIATGATATSGDSPPSTQSGGVIGVAGSSVTAGQSVTIHATGMAFPGHGSSINNLPVFVADVAPRYDVLERISEALQRDKHTARPTICVLSGIWGVGKTVAAQQYAARHAAEYDVVWWVQAQDVDSIEAGLAELATVFGLSSQGSAAAAARAGLSALAQRDRWLLIYDDAAQPNDLYRLMPPATGHVLITTRNNAWTQFGTAIPLELLSPAQATSFLAQRTGSNDMLGLSKLAAELGYLPLALSMAANYIVDAQVTPAHYLELYRRRPADLLSRGFDAESVASVFYLSRESVRQRNPAALRVLQILAFLAPNGVPRQLLAEATRQCQSDGLEDEFALDDALATLRQYSFVSLAADGVNVHPLVQQLTRLELSPTESRDLLEAVLGAVVATAPASPEDPQGWLVWQLLVPHVAAVLKHAHQSELASDAVSAIAQGFARYLLAVGRYNDAVEVAERHMQSLQDDPGSEDLIQAITLLATAQGHVGSYERARQLGEDGLVRSRKVLGDDHPDTLASATSLATTLTALGEHQQARQLSEDTLTRSRRVLGDDHPDTLASATSLATTLTALGEHQQARQLSEDTLTRSRRVLGDDHPDTLASATSLATTLTALGEHQQARQLSEDTLTRSRRVLGDDHPDTLASATSLATTLTALGEHQQARQLSEDIEALRRKG
ncbi:FxSxx-COOH system tetratricopeptide repeat protein [Micromonospora sp. IBSANI012]|uniref:FxSxx-COOH system tetratricopeptide repeat protein n=1 Tax=Micromonospora sp. IBSANI012 TaxID=3457761 RepID=UPI004058DF90